MDISLKHEDYKYLKILSDNTIEESVEAELTLPEYMPEILRIIKSTAETKINACNVVGDRVTIDGVCELRMIYTAEDGGIYSFSQTRPFARYLENPEFNNAAEVESNISVSYVNCRATGTKRAEIKAGLTIKFNIFAEEKEDIISFDDVKNIEQKNVSVKAMSLGCKKTRSFSMSDTITLNMPAAFLLSTKACAVCSETRKINNKIMVKGEAVVDICYVNSNDKTVVEHIKHNLPINQILEFDGMEEHYKGDVFLQVLSSDVIMKGESAGSATSFDVSLVLDAHTTMWEEKELVVIADAYAVDKALELQQAPYNFFSYADEIKDIHSFSGEFTISGDGVYSVVDSCGELTSIQVKNEKGELVISGGVNVSAIIKDSSGNISSANKIFDYSYKKAGDFTDKSILCKPDIVLTNLECKPKNSNSIGFFAEINISATVLEQKRFDVVTHITESDVPIKRNSNAITIYFPEKSDESLWAIARRYNTTVKAIASENDLTGDTTENLKMLFIPSV